MRKDYLIVPLILFMTVAVASYVGLVITSQTGDISSIDNIVGSVFSDLLEFVISNQSAVLLFSVICLIAGLVLFLPR